MRFFASENEFQVDMREVVLPGSHKTRAATHFDLVKAPTATDRTLSGRKRGGEGAATGFMRWRHLVPLEQTIRTNESIFG